ncbi:unnamed protein product, partial [marine sediment metagenome]
MLLNQTAQGLGAHHRQHSRRKDVGQAFESPP